MPDKLLKRSSIRRFLKSVRWVLGLVLLVLEVVKRHR